MAEKKKAPAKKKAAPKAPAPKVEAVNPVGRPRNVVKLTETDLSYDMKSFISSVTSADLTSDDVALAALWLSMKQCQAVGPSVMSSRMRMICDSLNG